MASDNLYGTNYKDYMKNKNGGKIPKGKAGYFLQVDPKKLLYEDLPCPGCKKNLMAEYGMYMDPGPRIPGLAQSVSDYYGGYPESDLAFSKVQGPVPIGTPPDTSKVKPGKPLGAKDLRPPKPTKGGGFNAGNVALAAMTAFDAILPNRVSKQQVVQPQMAYNPMSYGYGSQALEHGGSIPAAKNGKAMKSKKKIKKYDDGGLAPALFGLMDAFYGELGNAKQGLMNAFTGGAGGALGGAGGGGLSALAGAMEQGGMVEAKDGHWIQKAVNPKHKGYCTPMTKSTCTPKRKALAKTFKKHHGFHKNGGIIPDNMSIFSPHEYEQGGNVNGGAKINMVDGNFPNTDLMEQWLLYNDGGNVNGGAQVREVGATYPNTDMLEQWLLYAHGGNVNGGANIREVGAQYPNTDLMEQWLLYKDGGTLSADKAKEMLRDGTAHGKKLTKKQKQYFGMVAAGKAPTGLTLDGTGDPASKNPLSPQEAYYQSSAKLSYYKDLLNQKLKAKNPQAFQDYFKGLVDLRRSGNSTGADKYVQDTKYDEYLTPQEVQTALGERYKDYLESIKNVNGYNVSQGRQPLYGTVEGQNDLSNLNYGRRFASLQITPSFAAHNKDKNTDYSRSYSYNPQTNQVDFTETGDMKLKPDYLSNRTTPTVTYKNGGVMYDDGGSIDTMWGGSADLESYNPYDGGTVEFSGDSHAQGGIGMAYNGNPVEVEGGEYASKDDSGNLTIYGNMFIPGTKTKFKKAAKAIAGKEKRYDMLATKGSDLVNNSNPASKFDQLKFNAGRVMMEGGQMGMADLSSKKEKLASLQRAMLDMAEQHGLDPHAMSQGKMKKAKKGASIPFYQEGGSDPDSNDPTRADRNNNPGNIKYGKFAQKYGAKKDKDGFAIFPDRKVGEKAMQELLLSDSYKNLPVSQAIKKWTDGHPYRYDLGPLTDKTVSELGPDELSIVLSTMKQGEGTRYGMTPRPIPKTPSRTPTPRTPTPSSFTPYTIPEMSVTPENPNIQPVNPVPPYDKLEVPTRKPIRSNVEGLHLTQILPELYAAATNKVEPVPTQRYEPQLYAPYQVSFQDRQNANQSAFNAQMRTVGGSNPAALGTLAAQKYQADQAVLGDEFRTNQAIANDITNKNIALVNDANMKNLGIADTQMVRQSQARSKTRNLNQLIINSLSDKYSQNEFENKRLAAYENLYDYRFVPQSDGGLSATYFGPNAMFNYNGKASQNSNTPSRTISRYDAQGNLKGYAEYDDSDLKDYQRMLQVMKLERTNPLMQVPPLNK